MTPGPNGPRRGQEPAPARQLRQQRGAGPPSGHRKRQVQRQTQHVVFAAGMPPHSQGAVPHLPDPLDSDRPLGGAVAGNGQVHDVPGTSSRIGLKLMTPPCYRKTLVRTRACSSPAVLNGEHGHRPGQAVAGAHQAAIAADVQLLTAAERYEVLSNPTRAAFSCSRGAVISPTAAGRLLLEHSICAARIALGGTDPVRQGGGRLPARSRSCGSRTATRIRRRPVRSGRAAPPRGTAAPDSCRRRAPARI